MCVHGLVISGSESLRLWCHYWVSNIDDLWEIIVYNLSQCLERGDRPLLPEPVKPSICEAQLTTHRALLYRWSPVTIVFAFSVKSPHHSAFSLSLMSHSPLFAVSKYNKLLYLYKDKLANASVSHNITCLKQTSSWVEGMGVMLMEWDHLRFVDDISKQDVQSLPLSYCVCDFLGNWNVKGIDTNYFIDWKLLLIMRIME